MDNPLTILVLCQFICLIYSHGTNMVYLIKWGVLNLHAPLAGTWRTPCGLLKFKSNFQGIVK